MSVLLSFAVCAYVVVFFFKQKTAYELRISDWSSDVCSSDLAVFASKGLFGIEECLQRSEIERRERTVPGIVGRDDAADEAILRIWQGSEFRIHGHVARVGDVPPAIIVLRVTRDSAAGSFPLLDAIMAAIVERSEEHTSELQSLMRRSYAVFCS